MALVKMTDIMTGAKAKGAGIGSFSIYNLASLRAAIRAAEDTKTPIIIQVAEKRFPSAPLEYVGPMMMNAAKCAGVDIAVHLDHGESFDAVQRALDLGFTSVMYDGSTKPFAENVENTCRVMEMAKPYGAVVEAELGCMAKAEDGSEQKGAKYTRPEEVTEFLAKTGVDALAIAIGNQHGNYAAPPDLQFAILEQIHAEHPEQHLVLHGGSGISDADFQRCIGSGITKVNVATAMLNAMMKKIAENGEDVEKQAYYKLFEKLVDGVYDVVRHHIEVFDQKSLDEVWK